MNSNVFHNRSLRIVALMICCLWVAAMAPFSTTLAEEPNLTPMYPVVDDFLWIRQNPSLHSNEEIKLMPDSCFMVESIKDGWAYGYSGGIWGYAKAEFLSTIPMQNEEKIVKAKGGVIVREKPSKKSKRIDSLCDGEAVTVKGYVFDSNGNTWAKTTKGFIMDKFLRPDTDTKDSDFLDLTVESD